MANSMVRFTYIAGWVAVIVAVLYRGITFFSPGLINSLHIDPKTLLEVGGLMFVATIASYAYGKSSTGSEEKAKAKAAGA